MLKNLDVKYINATIKIKYLKSSIAYIRKILFVARSIPVLTPELEISTILDDVVSLNKAVVIITKFFLDLTTNICPIRFNNQNQINLVMINILCILTNIYEKKQVNIIFYRALYITSSSYFQDINNLPESTSSKQ